MAHNENEKKEKNSILAPNTPSRASRTIKLNKIGAFSRFQPYASIHLKSATFEVNYFSISNVCNNWGGATQPKREISEQWPNQTNTINTQIDLFTLLSTQFDFSNQISQNRSESARTHILQFAYGPHFHKKYYQFLFFST